MTCNVYRPLFFRGGECLSTAVEDIQELFVCVRKHANAGGGDLEVWSPRKILQIRCSESASEATFGPKRHYSYHCYLYVFVCCAKSPNF